MTPQRTKILSYVKSVKSHPTAENIYNAVKKDLPNISLATVYRNLNKLANDGEVYRFEINSEFRYDGDNVLHQHCVCNGCGMVIDNFQRDLSKQILEDFKLDEFQPESVTIIFRGHCKKCSKNLKSE